MSMEIKLMRENPLLNFPLSSEQPRIIQVYALCVVHLFYFFDIIELQKTIIFFPVCCTFFVSLFLDLGWVGLHFPNKIHPFILKTKNCFENSPTGCIWFYLLVSFHVPSLLKDILVFLF